MDGLLADLIMDDEEVTTATAVVAAPPPEPEPPALPLRVGNEVAKTPDEVIVLATRYLAGRCDGARTQDGTGFNRVHAPYGINLAETPIQHWREQDFFSARKMLERYKNTQLAFLWRSMPPLPAAMPQTKRESSYDQWKAKNDPNWTAPKKYRRMSLFKMHGTTFVKLEQSFDDQLREAIRTIPNREYNDDSNGKFWYVPLHLDSLEALTKVATEFAYDVDEDVENAIDGIIGVLRDTMDMSSAASASLDLDLPDGLTLFPFQEAGVQYALRVGNTLIADEMGLGKTVQALATIKMTNGYPAIIICPASLKRNWEREAKKWLPGLRVKILDGTVIPLRFLGGDRLYDVVIINYNSRIMEKWLIPLVEFGARTVVLDEAHNCKNSNAQQTKLVENLLKHSPDARRLFLSGTPVVNKPMEFWQLVKMLGKGHTLGGYTEFKKRYDNLNVEKLRELNSRSRSNFMIRRTKAEVLPELPPKMRTIVPLEIDNTNEYLAAESDIAGYFAKKKSEDEVFIAAVRQYCIDNKIGAIETAQIVADAKKERFNKAYDMASGNERLLRWEALKQVAIKGMWESMIEWFDEFFKNTDQKIVAFGDHTDWIEKLATKYNAPYIHGQVNQDLRDRHVLNFQKDDGPRLIVGNMKAMGEGLTLTAASNVAFFEYGWNPKTHDQAEDRCHRIGQHDSVMVWHLTAEGTIHHELAALILKKRELTEAIQDGDDLETRNQMIERTTQRLIELNQQRRKVAA